MPIDTLSNTPSTIFNFFTKPTVRLSILVDYQKCRSKLTRNVFSQHFSLETISCFSLTYSMSDLMTAQWHF